MGPKTRRTAVTSDFHLHLRPTKSEPSIRTVSSLDLLPRPKLIPKIIRSSYYKSSPSCFSNQSRAASYSLPCLNQSEERRKEKILNLDFIRNIYSFTSPANLSRLTISSLELTTVDILSMKDFTNLMYIDAGDNCLKLESFNVFRNLRELHLPLNNISSVNLTSNQFMLLQILDLSFNGLDPAAICDLGKLSNLKMLNLTANYLPWVPANLKISSFPSLEVLILDDNLLRTADTFMHLSRLKNLKTLSLEGNGFKCIPYIDTLATMSSLQMCLIDSWLSGNKTTNDGPLASNSSLSVNVVSEWSLAFSTSSDESRSDDTLENWTSDLQTLSKHTPSKTPQKQSLEDDEALNEVKSLEKKARALPKRSEAFVPQSDAYPQQTEVFKIKPKSSLKRQDLDQNLKPKPVQHIKPLPVRQQHPSKLIRRTGGQKVLHYLKRPAIFTGFWPMDPNTLQQLMETGPSSPPTSRKAILKNIDCNVMPWNKRILVASIESATTSSSDLEEGVIASHWTPTRESLISGDPRSDSTKLPRFKSSLDNTVGFALRNKPITYPRSSPPGSRRNLVKRYKQGKDKENEAMRSYDDPFRSYEQEKAAKAVGVLRGEQGRSGLGRIAETSLSSDAMKIEGGRNVIDEKGGSGIPNEPSEMVEPNVSAREKDRHVLALIDKLWSKNRESRDSPRLQRARISQKIPKSYQRQLAEPVYFKDERNPYPPFAELVQLNLARNKLATVHDATAIVTWQNMKEIALSNNPVSSTRILDLNPIRPYIVSKIDIPLLTLAVDTSKRFPPHPYIRKYQPTSIEREETCYPEWRPHKIFEKENVIGCQWHFVPKQTTQEMHTRFSLDIHEKYRRGVKALPLPFLRLCEYKKLMDKTLTEKTLVEKSL